MQVFPSVTIIFWCIYNNFLVVLNNCQNCFIHPYLSYTVDWGDGKVTTKKAGSSPRYFKVSHEYEDDDAKNPFKVEKSDDEGKCYHILVMYGLDHPYCGDHDMWTVRIEDD